MIDATDLSSLEFSRNLNKGLRVAALQLLRLQRKRIHVDGLASDGQPIGTYSEKSFFAYTDSFVSKSGIPSKNVSKSGKTVQLPEGYKSFRQYSGREADKVTLEYTGVLANSYTFELTETGFVTGYPGDSGTDGVTPAQKLEFAENNPRFGKREIITPTQDELDTITSVIANYLVQI